MGTIQTTINLLPIIEQIKTITTLLSRGEWRTIKEEVTRRLHSDETSYILRRDLDIPIEVPKAKIPISIRKLQEKDLASLLSDSAKEFTGEETKDIARRRLLIRANIGQCYVATNESDLACYMQCLIGKDENDKLQQLYKGLFAALQDGEMVLEGAFTPPHARGQGIMGEAMTRIADEGRHFGCRYVFTYVRTDNIASLKGCKNAGFRPYGMRIDRWRRLKRSIEFVRLPENSNYSFELG